MSKRVTVIVEGREYIVEVGDLRESPIKATVNQRTYMVEVPPKNASPEEQATPAEATASVAHKASPSLPAASNSAITAPMPGKIVNVKVKVGDNVYAGDVVCVLEAMKMKNMIHTSLAGVIASVDVISGQDVDYGEILVTLE
jgi:glutaconyl-CoA decarboxylase